jgi:hypothetical protein
MTVTEIFQQAKALSTQERKELVVKLVETLGDPPVQTVEEEHWGRKLNALLDTLDMSEWEAIEIDDPVEWVKAQREDERKHRLGDWGAPE